MNCVKKYVIFGLVVIVCGSQLNAAAGHAKTAVTDSIMKAILKSGINERMNEESPIVFEGQGDGAFSSASIRVDTITLEAARMSGWDVSDEAVAGKSCELIVIESQFECQAQSRVNTVHFDNLISGDDANTQIIEKEFFPVFVTGRAYSVVSARTILSKEQLSQYMTQHVQKLMQGLIKK